MDADLFERGFPLTELPEPGPIVPHAVMPFAVVRDGTDTVQLIVMGTDGRGATVLLDPLMRALLVQALSRTDAGESTVTVDELTAGFPEPLCEHWWTAIGADGSEYCVCCSHSVSTSATR